MDEKVYCYYLNDISKLSQLIVSYESLKKTNPRYRTCCLLGNEADTKKINDFLIGLGIQTLIGDLPLYDTTYKRGSITSIFYCLGKLAILKYLQFSKVVLIDADTLVKHNIDDLFDYPSGSMADHMVSNQSNGGIIVIEPNLDVFNTLLDVLDTDRAVGKFRYRFDQEFLSDYFKYGTNMELHIDNTYNMIINNIDRYIKMVSVDFDSVKIFHFGCIPNKYEDCTDLSVFNYSKEVENIIIDYFNYFDSVINVYKEKYPYIPLFNTAYNYKK